MKKQILFTLLCALSYSVCAQEIRMTEVATLEQVYGNRIESMEPLPVNELDIDFGYALYETQVTIETDNPTLTVENIRDFAAIYIDNLLQGTLTDNRKKLILSTRPGTYTLRIYVENIGRITYGPEILDNSKGLFGIVTLDGTEIENWEITELKIRNTPVDQLSFTPLSETTAPAFYKGYLETSLPEECFLDMSGWGMGEIWVNGSYAGSYWEEEKQQSVRIPASTLIQNKNEIVIFELKNNQQKAIRLSDKAIFK
ncbi:MAG: hypothetical protein LUG98_11505 [Tannerellaceae bacterium]|nr:hypothetical protein [Tannerellaceae bacterium]